MKYLKFISEYTIKHLIVKNLNLKVEQVLKNDKKCLVIIKSNGYDLNLKFDINDFEAICLENFNSKLFTKYFNEKYIQDLNDYLNIKDKKYIKNLRNYQIEEIFNNYKVLSIKRLNNSIEVRAINNINKELLSCYITNFKIINANPKLYKKEIKKIEKNYLTFMVSTYGHSYIEALFKNENKTGEDFKKC